MRIGSRFGRLGRPGHPGRWFRVMTVTRVTRVMGMALAIALGQCAAAAAQTARPFTVNVTMKDGAIDVALKAEDAPLPELAADLGKRLRANVTVGPALRQERVSAEFRDSALEPVLTSMAARVLVDYEIRRETPPIPRDIYLLGNGDPEPTLNTSPRAVSTGLLISGNTEDPTVTPADDPLLITGDRQQLSVAVRQQPLATVIRAAADVLGVPVDIRYDAAELIDLDVKNATPEDALTRLSPNVRVIVRVDANTSERTLVRLEVDRTPRR
jgi:hypothetical protein